ncbi:uncharacterized protein LOC111453632 isoform X1 [Cucurbita moschata]|uniref:Uncharacterized protein LOC111453632 isoform X1 n=2 Tax=Cucurbita moschata TaxID=3662 RepID=A0A6J1GF72_CUCMO|nr:uncharacterized protein LOC111453632 isoform X1 [Cucurbita moschata]XP_022950572.1 uncharacterized protein LOC111453632 isoform X1 [Cucurbita moschata]XP_022950573.1 uncharacterized protein LOC111453632 isoform X1 [Cucurbita moschata]XP_022950574.1 uncharacterized protein LOC111453632 isoform X1 [Cucurbita moschata]
MRDFACFVSGDRGFALPPLAKFGTGNLPPIAINGSQAETVKGYGEDCDSGSDMDLSSDSGSDNQSLHYSVAISPQDDKVHIHSAATNGVPLPSQLNNRCSEMGHKGLGFVPEAIRLNREYSHGGVKTSDSAATSSTEVSFGKSSTITYGDTDAHSAASDQTKTDGGIGNKMHVNFDIPTAPPSNVRNQEIRGMENQASTRAYRPYLEQIAPESSLGQNAQATNIGMSNASARNAAVLGVASPSLSVPACLPNYRAIGQGSWGAVISYEACVRLCLHSWAQGHCTEAPYFLNDECKLLRDAFDLRQALLQPEEDLLAKLPSGLVSEKTVPKSIRSLGKIKVQVRRVKMGLEPPTSCGLSCITQSTIKLESLNARLSTVKRTLRSEWKAKRKVRVAHHLPANSTGSISHQSLAYVKAGSQYAKQVLAIIKTGAVSLCHISPTYEVVQETYSCLLRLKSSSDDEVVKMQPASGETYLFFPNSPGDDLTIEVQNSKGQHHGHATVQVAVIADNSDEKTQWWPVYREPEHELVGRVQLHTSYSTSPDENHSLKCGLVAETVAYDILLEVAMKSSHFQQRNLLLEGPWKWLLYKFATYYGISDSYTKLRYLSYVMDVATPTEDCLSLVEELLQPVIMKQNGRGSLSRQENRMLLEIKEQIEKILALVFENYKSLDESSPSGIAAVFGSANGFVASALTRSVKLYALLHDVLSSEAQLKLCRYLQAATRKRSKLLLAEVDEIISSSKEGTLMDGVILSTAYQKMKTVVRNIRNEVMTDIEIHHQNVLPSFIDLPNLSSSIYSVELCNRLRDFLMACSPPGPSPPVTELVIATADFQQDLVQWNISPVRGGVDAKELFHSYVTLWIQSKRLALLELCKQDKVQPYGARPEHSTLPFVDDMYDRLRETLNEYDVIVCRWPEYSNSLEQATADIEKTIFESLERQYSDVLSPLKDNSVPIMLSKYFQKFARQAVDTFFIPDELGILLNTMKRMRDELMPQIERKLNSMASACMTDEGPARGEYLNEVTLVLRAKFRSYLHAVVEKLAENTRVQSATKLRKIIQDTKETMTESDIRSRMQPLKDLLMNTIHHLHPVLNNGVFVAICRCLWDRMGQDVLHLLENRKENMSSYKGLRIAVSVLDDVFASEMQRLLGNALQRRDLKPPTSIMEVRSILCEDAVNF